MSSSKEKGSHSIGMVDATVRRKWDKESYAKKARERLEQEEEALGLKSKDKPGKPVQRDLLKQREYTVDFEGRVGKSRVIESQRAAGGGFFCKVCDCVLKDSTSFLDHINGKKHQRNLGMSMKVEKSSASQVKARLEAMKQKKEAAMRQQTVEYDIEKQIAAMQDEDAKKKRAKKERRKQNRLGGAKRVKRNEDDEGEGVDEAVEAEDVDGDLQALMGFSGFGGSA